MTRGYAHAGSLPRDLDSLVRQAHRRDVLRLLGAASLVPFLGGAGAETGNVSTGYAAALIVGVVP